MYCRRSRPGSTPAPWPGAVQTRSWLRGSPKMSARGAPVWLWRGSNVTPVMEQTPLFLLGGTSKVGAMLKLETRRDRSQTALTVGLSCVLALYLFIAGLASAMQSAQSLDPHALCLTDAAGESFNGGSPAPASPHHHGLCCTWLTAVWLCLRLRRSWWSPMRQLFPSSTPHSISALGPRPRRPA